MSTKLSQYKITKRKDEYLVWRKRRIIARYKTIEEAFRSYPKAEMHDEALVDAIKLWETERR